MLPNFNIEFLLNFFCGTDLFWIIHLVQKMKIGILINLYVWSGDTGLFKYRDGVLFPAHIGMRSLIPRSPVTVFPKVIDHSNTLGER
jgi:hypothetical protein